MNIEIQQIDMIKSEHIEKWVQMGITKEDIYMECIDNDKQMDPSLFTEICSLLPKRLNEYSHLFDPEQTPELKQLLNDNLKDLGLDPIDHFYHNTDGCPICGENKCRGFFGCGHKICVDCAKQMKSCKMSSILTCPLCRHKSRIFKMGPVGNIQLAQAQTCAFTQPSMTTPSLVPNPPTLYRSYSSSSSSSYENAPFIPANDFVPNPNVLENQTISLKHYNGLIKISCLNESNINPIGSDIFILIDVSGSMEMHFQASLNAAKEMVMGVNEYDRISIIVFSFYAKQLIPLTPVNDMNRAELLSKLVIDRTLFGHGTNYKQGADMVMKAIKNARETENNRESIFFFLTDGESSDGTMGYPALQEIVKMDRVTSFFSTFGGNIVFDNILTILRPVGTEYERCYRHCETFEDFKTLYNDYKQTSQKGLTAYNITIQFKNEMNEVVKSMICENLHVNETKEKFINLQYHTLTMEYTDMSGNVIEILGTFDQSMVHDHTSRVNTERIQTKMKTLTTIISERIVDNNRYTSDHRKAFHVEKTKEWLEIVDEINTSELSDLAKSELLKLSKVIEGQLKIVLSPPQPSLTPSMSISATNTYHSILAATPSIGW